MLELPQVSVAWRRLGWSLAGAAGLLLGQRALAQQPATPQAPQQELRPDSASQQDIHPQDSPANRGFLVTSRDNRSSLRILGSFRTFGAYDLKGLQGARDFSIYDIPVGPGNVKEGRFYMEASQSRFGLEATTRKQRSVPELFGRIETDFRGTNNSLRLRHAFVRVSRFTVGQTWTTAAHVSTLPTTVDAEGPNSAISLRQVQVRYTQPINQSVTFSASAENPSLDVSTSADSIPVNPRIPDFVGRVRGIKGARELQVAGILRSLPYRDSTGRINDLTGFGVAFSGRFGIRQDKDEFMFQGLWGQGVSHYVQGVSGRGLDLTLDSATGTPYTTLLRGFYVSYGRLLRPGLSAYGTFGGTRIVNRAFEPPSAYKSGSYVAVSLFRDFPWGARAGAEYTFGRRVNKDGARDSAHRIQAIVYYDF